jgi:fibronectin-binding autotransporter adhesin
MSIFCGSGAARAIAWAVAVVLSGVIVASESGAATLYWDRNGTDVGATNDVGGVAGGTWSTTQANWSTDPNGLVATINYVLDSDVVFSAGTNATGTFGVTPSNTPTVNSITVEQGTISFGAPFRLTNTNGGTGVFRVASGLTTFVTGTGSLQTSAAVGLTKRGGGTLQLTTSPLVATGAAGVYHVRVEEGLLHFAGHSAPLPTGSGNSTVITLGSSDGHTSGTFVYGRNNSGQPPNPLNVAGLQTVGDGAHNRIHVNPANAPSILTIDTAGQSYVFNGHLGLTASNAIAQTGPGNNFTLTKTGEGTQTLSGDNRYTADTFITGGVLHIASTTAQPGSGDRSLINNTINISGGGVLGIGAKISQNNATSPDDFDRAVGGSASSKGFFLTGSGGFAAYGANRSVNLGGAATPQLLTWAGASSFLPGTSTLVLGANDADATLIFRNPLSFGGATSIRTIDVRNGSAAVDAELTGALGNGGLIKTGLGTLRLSGNSSYTNTTTVSQGTLLVAGSLGNTAVTVANGATLGGTGTLGGAVTAQNGSTIAPGQSPGSLQLASLNLQAGATLAIELGGAAFDLNVHEQYDRLIVTGVATLAGQLTVTLIDGFKLAHGQVFGILDAGTRTTRFSNFPDDDATVLTQGSLELRITYAGDISGNDVAATGGHDVVLYVIPEPGTLAILGLAAMAVGLGRAKQ